MEFSLREWLILIGVVIIIVILIDGFRRYKKGQELTHLEEDLTDYDDYDRDTADLQMPIRHKKAASVSVDPIVNAFESARQTAKSPLADVPHKVDSGPELYRSDDLHLDELASLVPERDFGDSAVSEQNYSDDGFYEHDDLDLDFAEDSSKSSTYDDYEHSYLQVDVGQPTSTHSIKDANEAEQQASPAEIEEVIVINILAPDGKPFAGMELLQLILNCGMRYGEMDIFHRHEDGFDRGRVQFSMANAIEPGTFDLDTMGETESPGVSFFMGLPGPKNSMKAFDFMLETAQTLVRNLGGELRDERRSPMSEQTIAHCRQRIRDFERRRLMRNKQ